MKIAQPLRVALTGRTISPPIDEVMEVLGKGEVIKRIEKAIEEIGDRLRLKVEKNSLKNQIVESF